jgi:NAD(P)-dependent dehydrogenase (short-subunit alcohol dehydrogenase family)
VSDDVRAVVTGAASGLGLAVVKELTAAGADVVGLDLAGGERAATVTDTGATFVACDVTSQDAWTSATAAIAERLETVTLLALNAGIMTRSPMDRVDGDPLELAGGDGYRRVFAVNVDGVVFGLVALRPLLVPGASVAVTASRAGLGGLPFDPYYSMTKHAVVGFVRSMADLLAPDGIRINALCPGGIDTAIVPRDLRSTVPAEAFRPPRDIARSLLAMAAAASSGGTWVPGADGTVREYAVPPHR